MKAFQCDGCGAQVKKRIANQECAICHRATGWTEIQLPDPSDADKKSSKTYEKIVDQMEKYVEGTPPQRDIYYEED